MKTIKETWRRSIATVALLTAFGAEPSAGHAAAPTRAPARPAPIAVKAPATPDGAVLQAKATSDADAAPSEPQPAVEPAAPAEQPPSDSGIYKMDPRLLQRYGLSPRYGGPVPANPTRPNRGKQQIEAKLNQITLTDILYDGLPLSEVVRDLNDQARKRDPAKQGINFLISNVPENPVPATGGIDPATGVPIPAVAPVVDLGATIVKLHLRDVRLKDVLDAMTRVSEQPIRYSVEDYGVLFSPAGPMPALTAAANHPPEPARLQVRTFKVDTNTFLAGLESAFGVTVPRAEGQTASSAEKKAAIKATKAQEDLKRAEELYAQKTLSEQEVRKARYDLDMAQAELEEARAQKGSGQFASARDIQNGLRQLLLQLGINMDVPNKAVFYNELTGIVMVRATSEDLEVVQAAIETLGGHLLRLGVGQPALTPTVSVIGKVNREGAVELPAGQKISILEAIARAGGFSPAANKNKIELSRNGQMTTFKFDQLKKVADPESVTWLEPGDVIYVHESFF